MFDAFWIQENISWCWKLGKIYINNCNARFVIFAKDIKILSMLMIMTHLVHLSIGSSLISAGSSTKFIDI